MENVDPLDLKTSILKPPRERIPLQSVRICDQDEDTTAVKLRRVSFYGKNHIKEFQDDAATHQFTSEYEEHVQVSDSSNQLNSSESQSHWEKTFVSQDSMSMSTDEEDTASGPVNLIMSKCSSIQNSPVNLCKQGSVLNMSQSFKMTPGRCQKDDFTETCMNLVKSICENSSSDLTALIIQTKGNKNRLNVSEINNVSHVGDIAESTPLFSTKYNNVMADLDDDTINNFGEIKLLTEGDVTNLTLGHIGQANRPFLQVDVNDEMELTSMSLAEDPLVQDETLKICEDMAVSDITLNNSESSEVTVDIVDCKSMDNNAEFDLSVPINRSCTSYDHDDDPLGINMVLPKFKQPDKFVESTLNNVFDGCISVEMPSLQQSVGSDLNLSSQIVSSVCKLSDVTHTDDTVPVHGNNQDRDCLVTFAEVPSPNLSHNLTIENTFTVSNPGSKSVEIRNTLEMLENKADKENYENKVLECELEEDDNKSKMIECESEKDDNENKMIECELEKDDNENKMIACELEKDDNENKMIECELEKDDNENKLIECESEKDNHVSEKKDFNASKLTDSESEKDFNGSRLADSESQKDESKLTDSESEKNFNRSQLADSESEKDESKLIEPGCKEHVSITVKNDLLKRNNESLMNDNRDVNCQELNRSHDTEYQVTDSLQKRKLTVTGAETVIKSLYQAAKCVEFDCDNTFDSTKDFSLSDDFTFTGNPFTSTKRNIPVFENKKLKIDNDEAIINQLKIYSIENEDFQLKDFSHQKLGLSFVLFHYNIFADFDLKKPNGLEDQGYSRILKFNLRKEWNTSYQYDVEDKVMTLGWNYVEREGLFGVFENLSSITELPDVVKNIPQKLKQIEKYLKQIRLILQYYPAELNETVLSFNLKSSVLRFCYDVHINMSNLLNIVKYDVSFVKDFGRGNLNTKDILSIFNNIANNHEYLIKFIQEVNSYIVTLEKNEGNWLTNRHNMPLLKFTPDDYDKLIVIHPFLS